MVHIAIMVTLLDHHGVAVAVVTLPDDIAIAIAIPIAMSGSDGYADRTDTDTNFFRTGRHRKGYSGYRYRGHYKTLDHRMFLSL